MRWGRIDDGFTSHKKVLALGSKARRWTWLEVLSYTWRFQSSEVPDEIRAVIPDATPAFLADCERVGLLDRDAEGRRHVHDWPIYSAETIAAKVAYVLRSRPRMSANEVHKEIGGTREKVLAEVERFKQSQIAGSAEPEAEPPRGAVSGSESGSGTERNATEQSTSLAVEEENVSGPTLSSDIQKIYDHWRKARSKTRTNYDKISAARRQKITSRLKEFTVDELLQAIDHVARDPWPDRAQHDDLTVIFRSREQVDRFLEMPPLAGVNGNANLSDYDRAKAWVIATGWRFDDDDLLDQLGRFGIEGPDKQPLAELAYKLQHEQETHAVH